MRTVWVWGDQLDPQLTHLRGSDPDDTRVLLVVAESKLRSRRWHVQKLHLVVTAMRRFARELEARGFAVDLRRAPSMREGLAAHVARYRPDHVRAMEPASLPGDRLLRMLAEDPDRSYDLEVVDNDHFLCHWREFERWAAGRTSLRMDAFYRWRRKQTGYLMDGDEPAGGRFSFDGDNREPPHPGLADEARDPVRSSWDDLDAETLTWLPDDTFGAPPDGVWPTSRRRALVRLRRFVEEGLPAFGDHQDAMVSGAWSLHHSLLSPALNLGLLRPGEVCDAIEEAYLAGHVPINAAEGFLRQVLGWREFVWGVSRHLADEHAEANTLDAREPLPPAFEGRASTHMACLSDTLQQIHDHGYAHHIQRLMVLANLATSAGVDPGELTGWMHASFVDAYDWVMVPNVKGMGTFADGGRITTKPYISGGAYLDRMSDHCGGCRYDPRARTGPDACPFTTLYWDVLDRRRDVLEGNPRMGRAYHTLDRLGDVEEVRERAEAVRAALRDGTL